ncbi:MAG: NAD+ synthase, partial [Planctomycetes bacterium]|nr:NAD+ synthase [Planctomycetota bacterium]
MLCRSLIATVAQLNPIVGDVAGNVRKIRETYLEANSRGAHLVVTPELSVTGYPLEDLANAADLLEATAAGLDVLRAATRHRSACLLVGAPVRDAAGVYNAVLVFRDGEVLQVVRKKSLPNYGVFDEMRNFIPEAGTAQPFQLDGLKVGVLICEDVWRAEPARELRDNGADLLVSVSASPFRPDALRTRVQEVAAARVRETGLPLLYVNAVGGQDEIVFDGGSFFMNQAGQRVLQMPEWEECSMDWNLAGPHAALADDFPDPLESTWRAMMTGVGDYVRKSGFTDVVLGLSGGIDSALAAAVACDALGPAHVHCYRLPSQYTADLSNT